MKSDDVRKIGFTGSTAVGKILMKQAADTVKKVNAPCFLLPAKPREPNRVDCGVAKLIGNASALLGFTPGKTLL